MLRKLPFYSAIENILDSTDNSEAMCCWTHLLFVVTWHYVTTSEDLVTSNFLVRSSTESNGTTRAIKNFKKSKLNRYQ